MRRLVVRTLRALVTAWILAASPTLAQPTLRYIGHQAIATTGFDGTRIGGLSGIDYDPMSGTYHAISDERSSSARHFTLQLDIAKFAPDGSGDGVRLTGVYRLRGKDGRPFAERSVDAESLRVDPRAARLFWASEGNPGIGVAPSVRETTLAGELIRTLLPPAKYVPRGGRGVRGNLAFESLTLSTDGARVIAATESALRQDGAPATLAAGSPCRVLVWDRASGRALHEYVYVIDPVARSPLLPGAVAMNGLSELLALDAQRMIALERSYSVGAGFTIRLYLTSFAGATDVRGIDTLTGATYSPMRKRLLLDLAAPQADRPAPAERAAPHATPEHAPPIDNYEGVTLGPRLPNGNRTLVLVSDDNFSAMQRTLFIAFELLDDAPKDAAAGEFPPMAKRKALRADQSAKTDRPALQ